MKKSFFYVLAMFLVFVVSTASADERLLGAWEHVYKEYAQPTKSTVVFKADGTVLLKSRIGNSVDSDDATWEADGKILHLSGIKFLGREDAEFSAEYGIIGDRLFFRQQGEDGEEHEEVVFTRVKERDKP